MIWRIIFPVFPFLVAVYFAGSTAGSHDAVRAMASARVRAEQEVALCHAQLDAAEVRLASTPVTILEAPARPCPAAPLCRGDARGLLTIGTLTIDGVTSPWVTHLDEPLFLVDPDLDDQLVADATDEIELVDAGITE